MQFLLKKAVRIQIIKQMLKINLPQTRDGAQIDYSRLFYSMTLNNHSKEFPNFTQQLITLRSNSEETIIELISSLQNDGNGNKQTNLLLFHVLFENHQIAAFIFYIKAYNIIETSQLSQLIVSVDLQARFCQIILQKRHLNWQLYVLLGEYLFVKEMYKASQLLFHHAIELNSSCHYAYYNLALLAILEQKPYYISRFMECAIYLNQESYIYYQIYSDILYARGEYEQSNCQLALLLNKIPHSTEIFGKMTLNYYGLYQDAETQYYARKFIEGKQFFQQKFEVVYRILAFTLLNRGEFIQSKEIIENFCQILPDRFQWHCIKGDYFLQLNDFETAKQIFIRAMDWIKQINSQNRRQQYNKIQWFFYTNSDPFEFQLEYVKLSYRLAKIYFNLQDNQNALIYATKLLQSQNQQYRCFSYLIMAHVYQDQNKTDQQIQYFCRKAQACEELDNNQKMMLSNLYYYRRQYQKCSLVIQQCSDNFQFGEKQYLFIMSQFRLKKVNLAINLFEKLVKQDRKQWIIYYGLGQIYLNLNLFDKAEKCLHQSLRLFQDSHQCFNKIGHSNINAFLAAAQLNLGNVELAISYSSSAITLNPKNVQPYSTYSMALKIKNQHSKALEICLKYIEQNPTVYQFYYEAGCYQIQLQLYQQALKHFLKLIQAKKSMHLAYEGIGFLQFKRKKYQKSSELFMRSISFIPTHFQAYVGLSVLFNSDEVSQKIKSQIMVFIVKIEQSPSIDPITYYNLSNFYLLIKQYHKSSELFWIMFKPLKEEYERENELCYDNKFLASGLIFKYYKTQLYRLKNYGTQNDHLNNFLLFKVIGGINKCPQLIQLMLKENDEPNQIVKLVKSNHLEYKQTCFEFLVDEMFKMGHKLGARAYQQIRHLQIIQKNQLDTYLIRSLNEAILQISQIIKVVSRLTLQNLDFPRNEQFKQNKQIKNLSEMLRLSRSLCVYQKQNIIENDLAIILDKISQSADGKELKGLIFKAVKVSKKESDFFKIKKLFFLIQLQQKEIKKRQYQIISKAKDLRQLCQGINQIIATLLSERYRKNEIIKLIWQKTYFLADLFKGKLDKLTELLQQFKQKPQLIFSDIEEKLMHLFFPEENLNQSKSEMDFGNSESQNFQNSEILDLSQIPSSFVQSHNSNNERACQSLIGQKIHKKTYSESDIKLIEKGQLKPYAEQSFQNIQELSLLEKTNLLTFRIFKNHYDLIHQLSNRQLSKDHIAKYHQHTRWEPEFAEEKKFTYEMEEGEAVWKKYKTLSNTQLMKKCIKQSSVILPRIFQQGELEKLEDIKIIDYLWREGEKEILKYIICLVKGIIELEELKIAHLDIEFRNVIKVNSVYKLMDFDFALSYGRTQVNEITFNNTLAIFRVIASYNSKSQAYQSAAQMRAIQFVFRDMDMDRKRKAELLEMLKGDGDVQNKVQELLIAFEKYAKQYHLRQLERMMKFLVVKQILKVNYPKINNWVNFYCRGKIDSQKLLKKLDVLCK